MQGRLLIIVALEIVVVEKRIEDFREWQTLIFLEVDYIVK
jgi:hypothetical protein